MHSSESSSNVKVSCISVHSHCAWPRSGRRCTAGVWKSAWTSIWRMPVDGRFLAAGCFKHRFEIPVLLFNNKLLRWTFGWSQYVLKLRQKREMFVNWHLSLRAPFFIRSGEWRGNSEIRGLFLIGCCMRTSASSNQSETRCTSLPKLRHQYLILGIESHLSYWKRIDCAN